MCNCDHNAIIVQVLGKVVKFLLAILLVGLAYERVLS